MKKAVKGIAVGALAGIMTAGLGVGAMAGDLTFKEREEASQKMLEAALEAAGVTEDQVVLVKAGKDIDNGKLIYEINFFIPGETKYEFDLDAETGDVISQAQDLWEAEDDYEYSSFMEDGVEIPDEATAEKLIEAALEAAGVTEDGVIFKKTEASIDDGRKIFEIDFFVPGETKYEFDLDAETGKILAQEAEPWDADDDLEFAVFVTGDTNDTGAAPGEITVEKAKEIALTDAGLSESSVTFVKNGKDSDDGIVIFDIDFIDAEGLTHEYNISAADGTILEKDVELDD